MNINLCQPRLLNRLMQLTLASLVFSGVASYGALGHFPLDFQQFHFLVYFGANLTANCPSIV